MTGRVCSATDNANARPDVKGVTDSVAARGKEHQPLTGSFLNLVDGLLEAGGVSSPELGPETWTALESSRPIE